MVLAAVPLHVRRYDLGSAPYQALLRDYLCGQLSLDRANAEDIALSDAIIRAADDRFAYVSFLADRREVGQASTKNISALATGSGLYRLCLQTSSANTAASRRKRSDKCWRCWRPWKRHMPGFSATGARSIRPPTARLRRCPNSSQGLRSACSRSCSILTGPKGGYRVLVIWECASRKPELAAEQIADFFKDADRQ